MQSRNARGAWRSAGPGTESHYCTFRAQNKSRLPALTTSAGKEEQSKQTELDPHTCQQLMKEGFANWLDILSAHPREKDSPTATRVRRLTKYIANEQKLAAELFASHGTTVLTPPEARSLILDQILSRKGLDIPVPSIVDALISMHSPLHCEGFLQALHAVLAASLETTVSHYAGDKAAVLGIAKGVSKVSAISSVKKLDELLSSGVSGAESFDKICETHELPTMEPGTVAEIRDEFKSVSTAEITTVLLHVLRARLGVTILLSG